MYKKCKRFIAIFMSVFLALSANMLVFANETQGVNVSQTTGTFDSSESNVQPVESNHLDEQTLNELPSNDIAESDSIGIQPTSIGIGAIQFYADGNYIYLSVFGLDLGIVSVQGTVQITDIRGGSITQPFEFYTAGLSNTNFKWYYYDWMVARVTSYTVYTADGTYPIDVSGMNVLYSTN